MPDRIQSQRILCQGGLNTSENFLMLSEQFPGSATALMNYEVAPSGGYRRINGYTEISDTYSEVTSVTDPAEGPVLGVWGFHNRDTEDFEIYAARKLVSGAEYAIYLFDVSTGWGRVTTGTTQVSTGVSRVRTDVLLNQDTNYLIIVDSVNKALVFDGTSWYQLDSGNAGGAGDPGGDQTLDAPAVVTVFKTYVIFGGDPGFPEIVAYSAPGDPLTWTAAAGGGQALTGFEIVQLKPFRDECYIFGESMIKKLVPDTTATFLVQDVTSNMGCVARDSVIELNSNILFFSSDGIRTVAGTDRNNDVELGPLTLMIKNTIQNIQDTYTLSELCSVTIRNKTQFRYFISDANTERMDAYGLIGGFRHASESWEFGQLSGIQANSAWSGFDETGEEVVLHGDYDGFVYFQEESNSFNGETITSTYISPYLDIGDTSIRKLFRRIDWFIRAEGALTANMEISYDWNSDGTLNPAAYPLSTSGSNTIFDGGFLFDDADSVFGGTAQPVFFINIQGSAFSIRVGIVSTSVQAPHTLQGFVINYSVKGRD